MDVLMCLQGQLILLSTPSSELAAEVAAS